MLIKKSSFQITVPTMRHITILTGLPFHEANSALHIYIEEQTVFIIIKTLTQHQLIVAESWLWL